MSPRKRAATSKPVDFHDKLLKALSKVDRPEDFFYLWGSAAGNAGAGRRWAGRGGLAADEGAGSKADQAVPAGTVWQGDRNGCRYRCAAIELKQLGVDRWITLAEEKGGG